MDSALLPFRASGDQGLEMIMEKFDVFASEGGYRYAGRIYLESPVIDQSPWFTTKAKAEKAAKAANKAEQQRCINDMASLGITEADLRSV